MVFSPGCIRFTSVKPNVTEVTVVSKYKPSVFAPIRPSCLTLPKLATPPTIENKTSGIAINLRQFIKIHHYKCIGMEKSVKGRKMMTYRLIYSEEDFIKNPKSKATNEYILSFE